MKIGYARVSSSDQRLDIQREALLAAGAEKVFEEKASGKTADNRPELQACIEFARAGDEVLVTRIDRCSRSARDLHNLLATLDAKGVGFQALEQPISTLTSSGRLTLGILSCVAEFEVTLRAERQREGILAAKARGTYKARKSQIDLDRVRELTARGMKPAEIAPIMRISRASVYRALAAIQEQAAVEPA